MIGIHIKDIRRVTTSRAAQILGCNYQRLTARVENDGAPTNADGTFDLPVIVKWWRQADGATKKETDVAARHKRAAMEAKEASASMAKIELARVEGTLIDLDEAEAWQADTILKARSALLALPTRVALLVNPDDPSPTEKILREEILHVLEDMSKIEEDAE